MADDRRKRFAGYYAAPDDLTTRTVRQELEDAFQAANPDAQRAINEQRQRQGWPRVVPMRDNSLTGKLKQLAAPVTGAFGLHLNTVPENGSRWGGTEDLEVYQGPGNNPLDRAKAQALIDGLRR